MSSPFNGGNARSQESKALEATKTAGKSFVNKDFAKNVAFLNQTADTHTAWLQKLQSGVDAANSNILDQVSGFWGDLFVLFAGFEPTGVDVGDVKYIIQGLGAFFGINPNTPFPLNLLEGAAHFFNTYIFPLDQFTDVIFDAIFAWAGELGLSPEFVDSIRSLLDAVLELGQSFSVLFGGLGEIFGIFGFLGFGSTSGLGELWDALVGLIDGLALAPLKPVLGMLADLGIPFINALTGILNGVSRFFLTPLSFISGAQIATLGPNFAPNPSNDTTVWSVGSNSATVWIFDPAQSSSAKSAGSFTTLGSGSAKRMLSQEIFPCTPGQKFVGNAMLRWDGIPSISNDFGIALVWFTGNTEVSQTNLSISSGHGSIGGWADIAGDFIVPINVDGLKIAVRVGASINTGQVWVDDISLQLEGLISQNLISGLVDALNTIGNWIEDLVNSILDALGLPTAGDLFERIFDLSDELAWIKARASDAFSEIASLTNSLLTNAGSVIGQIPQALVDLVSIPANLITGLLDVLNIPTFDASKIVSGVLNVLRIPNIDAGKIISGAFDALRIPLLDASKIISGIFGPSRIPPLDASKVTTGAFAQSFITGLPDLATAFGLKAKSGTNLASDQWVANPTAWGSNGISSTDFGFPSRKVIGASQRVFMTFNPGGNLLYFDAAPGRKYRISCQMYAPATNIGGTGNISLLFRGADAAGANPTYSIFKTAVSSVTEGQWVLLSAILAIPNGSVQAVPYVEADSSVNAGDVFYFRDFQVFEVTETQSIISSLFGANSIGATILNTVVPPLDASKVTTGNFLETLIPVLTTGKIPDLNASKITAGTLLESLVPLLTSAKVPVLDASKITTGNFLETLIPLLTAGKIPDLNASKITAGTFLESLVPLLTSGKIPALDGSKITTGSIAQARLSITSIASNIINGILDVTNIPDLNANKIVSGFLDALRIPTLDASKITTGNLLETLIPVLTTGKIPNLNASKITAGTFLETLVPLLTTAKIPALDGSKITTGSIDQARLTITNIASNIISGILDVTNIPDLNANKIVAGFLDTLRIPTLDASKVTTGSFLETLIPTLTTGKIPDLNASKITAGTLLESLVPLLSSTKIPSLDGSKITSGSIAQARLTITSLAASIINSGIFGTAQIPALDASKVTSGTLLSTIFPDITRGMSSDLQGSIDAGINALRNTPGQVGQAFEDWEDALSALPTALYNKLGGNAVARASQVQARDAMETLVSTINSQGTAISELQNTLGGGAGFFKSVIFRQPETKAFTTPGSFNYTLPSWFTLGVDKIDGAVLGAGGGGQGNVGGSEVNGGNGGNSILQVNSTNRIGTGGAGNGGLAGGGDGQGAGSVMYHDVLYLGGAKKSERGSPGFAPGGGGPVGPFSSANKGGNAGTWNLFEVIPTAAYILATVGEGGARGLGIYPGGRGADGVVHVRARAALPSAFTSKGTQILPTYMLNTGVALTDSMTAAGSWSRVPLGGAAGGHMLKICSNTAGTTYVYLRLWSVDEITYWELGRVSSGTKSIWKSGTISEAIPFNVFSLSSDGAYTFTIGINGSGFDSYTDSAHSSLMGAAYRSGSFASSDEAAPGSATQFAFLDSGTPARITSNEVATSQTTTSTAYTDLATSGPSVTVNVPASGDIVVDLSAAFSAAGSNQQCFMGVVLSGANTQVATDAYAAAITGNPTGGPQGVMNRRLPLTGLAPGTTTFKAQYRTSASTATISNRIIIVEPKP